MFKMLDLSGGRKWWGWGKVRHLSIVARGTVHQATSRDLEIEVVYVAY